MILLSHILTHTAKRPQGPSKKTHLYVHGSADGERKFRRFLDAVPHKGGGKFSSYGSRSSDIQAAAPDKLPDHGVVGDAVDMDGRHEPEDVQQAQGLAEHLGALVDRVKQGLGFLLYAELYYYPVL